MHTTKSMGIQHIYTKKLFGGEIDIVIDTIYQFDENTLQQKVDAVYEYALKLQHVFNFFDPTSEISQLNTNRSGKVSDDLVTLIQQGIAMGELTEGAYDISLGKYILERKLGNPVSEQVCSYKDISIDGNTINLHHPDAMIDLGSIAKGYITDCIAKECINQGLESGLIDSRGDILAFGLYSETLGIQHPRDKDGIVLTFPLYQQAVATSGDYNQFDTDFTKSHILHQGHDSSITVVAKTLTQADMIATAMFVSDTTIREKIVKTYPDVAILCVSSDMQINIYNDTNAIFTLDTSL